MSDDLIARAKAASEGYVVPETWGKVVEIEEGASFIGRFRGQEEDARGEPIFLFWDEDDEPRFFWSSYRLRQGMEREQPKIGDTVAVFRDENYTTRYDDEGEASGLAYGVAVDENNSPLPETTSSTADEPAADDDIPY